MPRTRLTAEERHEQLVAAAVTAFSLDGYAGTTTDQVARIAGVSQPYVIRIFHTKQELFLAAIAHAERRIKEVWQAAAADSPTIASLGEAYTERLLTQRELITVLLHGFVAGNDPVIGEQVRACFGRLYLLVQELTGASPEEAREFFATGMLLTIMAAMRAIGPEAVPEQPWVTQLMGTLD